MSISHSAGAPRLARVWPLIYGAVALVHLLACLALDYGGTDRWSIFAVTKCMLVPLLMAWLRFGAAGSPADLPFGRVQAGLLACLVGDVALLLPGTAAFLAGMGAFGVAHILFMTAWVRPLGLKAQLAADRLIYVLPLFVFVYIVYSKVEGGLSPALKIPIILYMALLVGDCFCAFLRRVAIDAPSSASIVNGAFLFVQSDSLIALNEFVRTFPDGTKEPGMPWAQLMVMGTYIVGLYLIVRGCIARSVEAPAADGAPAAAASGAASGTASGTASGVALGAPPPA